MAALMLVFSSVLPAVTTYSAGIPSSQAAAYEVRLREFDEAFIKPNKSGDQSNVIARLLQLQPGARFRATNSVAKGPR